MNDLAFANDLKKLLLDNVSDLKRIEIFQVPTKTQFPILVISYDSINGLEQTTDSSREIKYQQITLSLDLFTKETNDLNKYEYAMTIKNQIISTIANSEQFQNLFLRLDRVLPNFDSSVCRWRLSYTAKINCLNNTIL